MENEKFQELVLNHLAMLTREVTELKGGQQRMDSRLESMESWFIGRSGSRLDGR